MEIEKEIVREDARMLKTWRKTNCWAQIIKTHICFAWWWFVLNNWFFFKFLTPAHPHAQSLFLFPIVFGIIWSSFSMFHRGDLSVKGETGSVKGETIVRIFGKGSANLSPILARQWWRHFRLTTSVSLLPSHYFRLTLSLSLSPIVPHAQYRKRLRASYNKCKRPDWLSNQFGIIWFAFWLLPGQLFMITGHFRQQKVPFGRATNSAFFFFHFGHVL